MVQTVLYQKNLCAVFFNKDIVLFKTKINIHYITSQVQTITLTLFQEFP